MPIHAVALCDASSESFLLFLLSSSLSSIHSASSSSSKQTSVIPPNLPSFCSEPLLKKILHKMFEDSVLELQAAPLESVTHSLHSIKLSYIYQGFMYNFRYFPNCPMKFPSSTANSTQSNSSSSTRSLSGLVYFCLNSLTDSSQDSFQFLKDLHTLYLRLSNDGAQCSILLDSSGVTRRALENLISQRMKGFDSGKLNMTNESETIELDQNDKVDSHDTKDSTSSSSLDSDRVGLLCGTGKSSDILHEDEKTSRLKHQLSSVQQLISSNLRSAAERGEKIDELMETSESLTQSTEQFNQAGKKLKRQMCLNVWKIRLLLMTILGFVCYSVAAAACGTKVDKC
jgi:hypothetical protein